MIPTTHHGSWKGDNRLWFEGPAPERADGRFDVGANTIRYAWSFRGDPQKGTLDLFGPASSARAEWKDSWHAANGMTLHGVVTDGVLLLYGTYGAGDGPDWGWRIELDARDPEFFTMRMFNVEPSGKIAPAVDLRASRA